MNTLHKILVVDDDPVIGRSFDRVLSDKGYLVITAKNAQEALSRMEEGDYDIVVTDIKMPGMSGIELAERVKASRPWTPVVIVTGYGSRENETRAKSAGVSSFLHKPLSPEMIEDSMSKALHDTAPLPVVLPEPVSAAQVTQAPAPRGRGFAWKALVIAPLAPFIGLLYVAMLPLIGLAMLLWFGIKALPKNAGWDTVPRVVKSVGVMLAAPFIGLAYVALLPLVGIVMLSWQSWQNMWRKSW